MLKRIENRISVTPDNHGVSVQELLQKVRLGRRRSVPSGWFTIPERSWFRGAGCYLGFVGGNPFLQGGSPYRRGAGFGARDAISDAISDFDKILRKPRLCQNATCKERASEHKGEKASIRRGRTFCGVRDLAMGRLR